MAPSRYTFMLPPESGYDVHQSTRRSSQRWTVAAAAALKRFDCLGNVLQAGGCQGGCHAVKAALGEFVDVYYGL